MFDAKVIGNTPQPTNDGTGDLLEGLASLFASFGAVKKKTASKIEFQDNSNGMMIGQFLAALSGEKAPIKSISSNGVVKSFLSSCPNGQCGINPIPK